MRATNFNTRNDTYRKLLGNGLTYRVPRFQRDYSWGDEEWEDLWLDILGTLDPDGETGHYMGYLVLQTKDDKQFDIIDGQQRLTTLSILVLAALRQLKTLMDQGRDAERVRQRLEGLRQTYIGYLDPVTLVPRSKLTLNRNNDDYYQTYLVPLADSLPRRGFKASEHGLRKAFEWFERRIHDHVNTAPDPGIAVARLVDEMSDRLFFTVITVDDELNAYKVFETLNSRGVRLSATDLLKNYLFSILHREGQHERELRALDDRWEQVVGRLGAESLPDFLRVHWISRRSFVRQSELFKTIRGQVADRQDVFRLLQEMESDVDAYLALTQPDASEWTPDLRKDARCLRLFGVRQPLPLLMAAHRALPAARFASLLRCVVAMSFRYNVICNYQTSEQERTYHAEAARVARAEHRTDREILEALRPVYPSDEQFRSSFTGKTMSLKGRSRRILRYILCELERQASGLHLDYEDAAITLEHICPLNPADGWPQFTDEEIDTFTSRLGNILLLERRPNRDIGNAEYPDKRSAYAGSAYRTTQNVAEQHAEWSPDRIESRQAAMARVATGVWRIPQLG